MKKTKRQKHVNTNCLNSELITVGYHVVVVNPKLKKKKLYTATKTKFIWEKQIVKYCKKRIAISIATLFPPRIAIAIAIVFVSIDNNPDKN